MQNCLGLATDFVAAKNIKTVQHKMAFGSCTLDFAPFAIALSCDLVVINLDSATYTWTQKPEIQPTRLPSNNGDHSFSGH